MTEKMKMYASWYARGVVNRTTFIYHWMREQEKMAGGKK
jgi:hypothetical protein